MTPQATIADPLITSEPCEYCEDLRHETETGAGFCAASPSGDYECVTYQVVHLLEHIAVEAATWFARLPDHEMRRELAEGAAGGFSNALYVQGHKAEFGNEAFLAMCGVARRVGG